jgi:hypothetical protein
LKKEGEMRMYNKLLLAIVLVSLIALLIPAQVAKADGIVTFPDPNLEQAIRDELRMPTGDIYESDLARLTVLHATERGIIDLTGLEYCTNLTVLWLPGNQISDITPIGNLTNLLNLYLGWNPLGDLSPLSSLASLTILDLRCTQISDISALSGLTSANIFYLDANQISDVSPLSSLTSLAELWIGNNTISDISGLSSTTGLTKLYLYENQISDVSPLVLNAGLSGGDWVNLRHNPLSEDSISLYIPELQGRGVRVFYDSGGCFIATAAYGTSTAEELDTLRAFRDDVLLQNSIGSQFVEWYYQTSPPVADFISEHQPLRTVVRELLVDPIVWLVEATGTLWRD